MISIALLAALSLAETANVLLSVWSESEACGTAPQQLYVFPVIDKEFLPPEAPGQYKIPPFYTYMAPPYPLQYCGNLMMGMADDCCFSAIHNYQGVQSGIAKFLDSSIDLYSQMPSTVNSNIYCRVFSPSEGNSFPYSELFILQNGQCLDNFQCLSNGILRIYEMPGCSGSFEDVNSNAGFPIASTTFGNITTRTVTISSGSKKVGWVAYYPATDLVPRYRDGLEVMETTLFVSCIVGQLLICIFVFRRYRLWKTQQLFLLLCTQALLFLFVTIKAAYYYAVFESTYAMWALKFTQQFLYGLSTLACSLYTTYVIVEVTTPTEHQAKNMYLTVLIVHFIFGGSSYVLSLYMIGNWELNSFLLLWARLWQVWITIYMLSNIVPLSVVMFRKVGIQEVLVDDNEIWQKCKAIHQIDPYYFLVVFTSYSLALLYLIIAVIQSTPVLGSDRAQLAFNSIRLCCLIIQSAITAFLNDRIRFISLQQRINSEQDLKEISTTPAEGNSSK